MAAFRILVADSDEAGRKRLVALLQQQPDWQVCGEAGDGREAVAKAQQLKPALAILDIDMPVLNGIDATRQILKTNPGARILILALHHSDSAWREVVNAGARGFLLKSDAARDLVTVVETLLRDKTYFTSKVAAMVPKGYWKGGTDSAPTLVGRHGLTPREREVVQLLVEGKSTKEVAVALGLSVRTAETHRSNIMRKLHLHSVSDLVLYAVRNNIVHVVQAG